MICNAFSSILIRFRRSLRNSLANRKPSVSIDDLPAKMITELFKHLPLKDLVACSMVNRRWHSIFAAFKLRRLVVICPIAYCGLDHLFEWSYPDRRVEELEQCGLMMFRRLAEKPLLLSNLSHLVLFIDRLQFDLNKLNRFRQLVHLEISTYLDGKVHLNLPRLKVLAFHRRNYGCWLSIDCPLLSTLVYRSEKIGTDLLKVKQPETIRKLDTDLVDPIKLARFKNVECLVTGDFRAINKAILLSLPELKELRYNVAIENSIGRSYKDHSAITVDLAKRKLSEFMDEAKKLRGSDFRLIFAGFDLTNVNVEQIDFRVRVHKESGNEVVRDEYVYLKNYHLIEPGALHFVRFVDYSSFLILGGGPPRFFFQKFTGICSVQATAKVRYPDHFLWFLSSLRFLKKLSLEKTMLSQEFYDQLPTAAPLLTTLALEDGHCEDGLHLNFDFIGRFSRLLRLMIKQALFGKPATSLVRTWVKSGKFGELALCIFFVRWKGCVLKILKHWSSAKWEVKGSEWLFETENPEEILNFFDGH